MKHMKVIPKSELIIMLDTLRGAHISEEICNHIFEEFGDDYSKDSDESEWKKVSKNSKREELLAPLKEQLVQKTAELLLGIK